MHDFFKGEKIEEKKIECDEEKQLNAFIEKHRALYHSQLSDLKYMSEDEPEIQKYRDLYRLDQALLKRGGIL